MPNMLKWWDCFKLGVFWREIFNPKVGLFFNVMKKSQKKSIKQIFENICWILFFNSSSPAFIWERQHLTKLWYLHFPAHTSNAFQQKKDKYWRIFPSWSYWPICRLVLVPFVKPKQFWHYFVWAQIHALCLSFIC